MENIIPVRIQRGHIYRDIRESAVPQVLYAKNLSVRLCAVTPNASGRHQRDSKSDTNFIRDQIDDGIGATVVPELQQFCLVCLSIDTRSLMRVCR
jgi:hypothetical protein